MPFQISGDTAVITALVIFALVQGVFLYSRESKFRQELAEQVNDTRQEGIAMGRQMGPFEATLERERKNGWAAAIASLSYYHATYDKTKHGWFTTEKTGASLFLVVTDEGTRTRALCANFSLKQLSKEDIDKVISTFVKVGGFVAGVGGHPIAGAVLIAAGAGSREE